MDTKSISKVFKIGLILILVSCSPQKRINRIVKNNPHLLAKDTIRIIDTIIVPNYSYDTINTISYHDTTIIVNNDRVEARYYYDTLRQEIYHEIQCKTDTVIKDRLIPIEKIVVQEQTLWQKYGSLAIVALLILLVLSIVKKFKLL